MQYKKNVTYIRYLGSTNKKRLDSKSSFLLLMLKLTFTEFYETNYKFLFESKATIAY